MAQKRYYVPGVDPIMELIYRQLASLPLDLLYTHRKGNKRWSAAATSTRCSTNYIEDIFIEAIDRKYSRRGTMDEVALGFLISGFSIEDIAALLGWSRSKVEKSLQRSREEIENGNYSH